MPSQEEQGTFYGNLQSYKYYSRPIGLKLLGISQKKESKQSKKITSILRILSQKGSCTTWDMAKVQFSNDISKLRNREKEYRRLIIGRKSPVKQYPGLLEMGFVVKDGVVLNRGPATKYRLSLHGILFCIDALNFSDKEIDIIAEKYSTVIPKIFGKWKFLKTILNENVYKIRLLARGLLLDNIQNTDTKNFIFYQIMSFINLKYQRYFDSIDEENLSEQISYWFFTSLLHIPRIIKSNKFLLSDVITHDKEIKTWYMEFINDIKKLYVSRLLEINNLKI